MTDREYECGEPPIDRVICHHPHSEDPCHLVDRGAPTCGGQLPAIAHMGRGPKGDSYKVEVDSGDTCAETYLHGYRYDETTKEWKSDWISENVNGGCLMYQYNLRPYQKPKTFTITFIYRRPHSPKDPAECINGNEDIYPFDECSWSWTTPAIPYVMSIDDDGLDDGDKIVGSGVATLFIKTAHDDEWNERLKYPDGTTREDFNAPLPDEAWAATITFGKGGDVEVPDFDDLAKIIGVSKEDIWNILEDNSVTINGIDADNLIDYIDKCDKRDIDHIHRDLGFNSTGHPDVGSFGGYDTVKAYIDAKIKSLEDKNANLKSALQALVNKVYGGGTVNDNGTITWKAPANTMTIPVGNINVLSDSTSNAILTHAGDRNADLKGQ